MTKSNGSLLDAEDGKKRTRHRKIKTSDDDDRQDKTRQDKRRQVASADETFKKTLS
jgi:hypothetical protein